MSNNQTLIKSLSNQWAGIALLEFLKDSQMSVDDIKSLFTDSENYAKDQIFINYLPELPRNFYNSRIQDLDQYRIALEKLLTNLTNKETITPIINSTSSALRSAIIIGARIIFPHIEIIRTKEKSPIKSGIIIPQGFYPLLTPFLAFIHSRVKSLVECYDSSEENNNELDSCVFNTMLDILLKRTHHWGIEGDIIGLISEYKKISLQILGFFQQMTSIKETPRIKNKLEFLVNGIKCIRYKVSTPEELEYASRSFKEWITIINSVRGNWNMNLIIKITNESFIYCMKELASSKVQRTEFDLTFSSFLNVLYHNAMNDQNVESIQSFLEVFRFASNDDFSNMCHSFFSMLLKNIKIHSFSIHFKFLIQLAEAGIGRSNDSCKALFNSIIDSWFIDKTKFNPQYVDEAFNVTVAFSSVYQLSPNTADDFLIDFIVMNVLNEKKENYDEMLSFTLSTLYYIISTTKSSLAKPLKALTPYLKQLAAQESFSLNEIKLAIPLFTNLWEYCEEIRPEITTLLARAILVKDIDILALLSCFFSDILKDGKIGSISQKLIISFINQFVKNFDEIIGESSLLRCFDNFYDLFEHFFNYYKNERNIDEKEWIQLLSPIETRIIAFALYPLKDIRNYCQAIWNLLNSNQDNLSGNIIEYLTEIENLDKSLYRKIVNVSSFSQKYKLLATFFVKIHSSFNLNEIQNAKKDKKQFIKQLSWFLFTFYRPEYFDQQSQQINEKIVSLLLNSLPIFSYAEVFLSISVQEYESFVPWNLFLKSIVELEAISFTDRMKYLWSISSHIKFSKFVNESKEAYENLKQMCDEYLATQKYFENELYGLEFCSSFIRSSSSLAIQYNDDQSFVQSFPSRIPPDSIIQYNSSVIFAILEVIHAFIDLQELEKYLIEKNDLNAVIEDILDWTLSFATKTKDMPILQLKSHAIIKSLIKVNHNSMNIFLKGCIKPDPFATLQITAGIVSLENVSKENLAILSICLSSRPSLLCRAFAAEICNTLGGSFSPLSCLDPFFNENLVEFYKKSLNNQEIINSLAQIPELQKFYESSLNSSSIPSPCNEQFQTLSLNHIETIFKLTSITDFNDFSPIKPIISLWDRIFTELPDSFESILQKIINTSISSNQNGEILNSRTVTAVCIAFWRAFIKSSTQTAQFLLNNLRAISEFNPSYDDLQPTDVEKIISAILSFILSLIADKSKFVICFLPKLQFLLLWGIFLKFNPSFECSQLPPLITSLIHAAVPTSSLSLFVVPPSQCIEEGIYTPFHRTTKLTLQQMQSFIDLITDFSMLTKDLFLDLVANKAQSLAKYSNDFWGLFANFFQPRHSLSFLNTFVNQCKFQSYDYITSMLPILIGVVKQKANPLHISGFITVLVSVLSMTDNVSYLLTVNSYLLRFTEAVLESDDSKLISTNLNQMFESQKSVNMIIYGFLSYIVQADKVNGLIYSNSLSFINEICQLLVLNGPKFMPLSLILYCFDAIRFIETHLSQNGIGEKMICLQTIGIEAPSPSFNYDQLSAIIHKNWDENCIVRLVNFLLTFIGLNNILFDSFKLNLLLFVKKLTNEWENYIEDKQTMLFMLGMCIIGVDDQFSDQFIELFNDFYNKNNTCSTLNIIEKVGKIRTRKWNSQILQGVPFESCPLLLDLDVKSTEDVCDYVLTNILQ